MFRFIIFPLIWLALSFSLQAQTINLTTEHYPPYNIDLTLDGKGVGIGGASTEIVLEMMRRSGYSYTLDLMSWKRAYGSALEKQYTGVFSTTRTEEREKLFKWVGPIVDLNFVLLAKGDRNIEINNIEDIKNYTVGAYRGDAGESLVKSMGIEPESVRSDHLNTLKLQRNRIDLWVTSHLYGPYLAKQYGVTGLKEAYLLRKAQMYLALHLDTPDAVINKLNKILQRMRNEGFFDEVYKKYR